MGASERTRRHIEEDERTFEPSAVVRMRSAVADLSWLLTRSYPDVAALSLVGDRYGLDARQRIAVRRTAASDEELARRAANLMAREAVANERVLLDGYNLLTTVHCALVGRAVFLARDECIRDLAAQRGRFDNAELLEAARLVTTTLDGLCVERAVWLFDEPVSGSGELAGALRARGAEARTDADPDATMISAAAVAATADSRVIEASPWINLGRWAIEDQVMDPWVVDLREAHPS